MPGCYVCYVTARKNASIFGLGWVSGLTEALDRGEQLVQHRWN